ncbi:glycosyltransferase 52 family protein [Vibrio cholerae]|uniref:glycosyltransferase 52 family protein n=1 Tax=Vibrio TaxID=662 RepID=UPI0011D98243|nr:MULTISPECIES: glycosyltransferase 52 family protein [Vibrio]MCO7023800.1 alpha-2,8-polysialyltransferase family protein [Vibrio paracholerae]TXY60199.1 glycosyltransferase 52 family protein [Vibrio cholerae]GHX95675.1 glycosyltransferase 52 family protein [Vibrio cholerae]
MNLFLVTSPLQYICALEAKQYFSTENNILLLVDQTSEHGLEQQRKLINSSEWDKIITIKRGNRSFSVPSAIKIIKKFLHGQSLQNFFYAEYNSWRTKLLIRNLPIKREIYFDDGTLTLLEYSKYILPKVEFYRPRLLQDLIIRMNGCFPIGHLPQSNNMEIFTIFNLDAEHITIHTNKLDRLKQLYGNKNLFNPHAPIGFIGQGAVGDRKRKPISQYLDELSVLANHAQKKIIYFPHRTEKQEVREALEQAEYIIYHRSEFPLEIEMIDKNIQLSTLVGTLSTVMFTSRILYPDMPIYTLSDEYPNKLFQQELRKQMKLINVKSFEEYSCS